MIECLYTTPVEMCKQHCLSKYSIFPVTMWEECKDVNCTGGLQRCQEAQVRTVHPVLLLFKWSLLSHRPVLVSISVNIPLSWQLMLPRTEQLLTVAQSAFLWQRSLSWTVSPLSAAVLALLSPPPRIHPSNPPPHPNPSPTALHTSHLLHLSQEGNTVISLLG